MIWILHLVIFVVKVPKIVTTRELNYSPKRAQKNEQEKKSCQALKEKVC